MLSIGAMKSGQCDYYLALAKEDYYLHGGEPAGVWLGKGAEALGLKDQVAAKDLAALFVGLLPNGEKLVQNAVKPNRQPGWDLTFSVPKSVSVLWSQLEGKQRRAVQEAHWAAVKEAIQFIEEHFARSRVGKRGIDQVEVNLVIAAFEHSCSRALDPQLHTHCLVMNLGVDPLGRVRSILSKPLYQAKMLAGAYYRCELARQLQQRLGVEIERPLNRDGKPQPWFEVRGVPKSLLSRFSTRRAAIEKELGSRGLESASAAAFAALATRPAKSIVPPRQELSARWRDEGHQAGFQPASLLSKPRTPTTRQEQRRYRRALAEAVAQITTSENYFTPHELTRRTLEAAQGLNLEAAAVAKSVSENLQRDRFFVCLGTGSGRALWTTQEVLDLERQFLHSITTLRERTFLGASQQGVESQLTKKRGHGPDAFYLDEEQQAAVRYLAQGQESIKVVSGFAGTGKTDMLAVAKEVLEKEGYRVLGAALSGAAARNIQEKTGIESETIRKREFQLAPTLDDQLKHHVRQLGRAALGKPTYSLPRLKIDNQTVLVVDEASMVSTRDLALLARAVVAGGGGLVAVGDERQLPAIERGGGFDWLVKEVGGVRLSEIRRQHDQADREAVKAIVEGRPVVALDHYIEKGQFCVARRREDAEAELVADWKKFGGVENPKEHRILAGTRAEVEQFNRLCQSERAASGMVDASQQVEHQGTHFLVGDAVRFDLAARTRGIQKGDRGTIVACRQSFLGTYVAVALDKEQLSMSARTMEVLKHHGTQRVNAALGRATQKLSPRHDIVVVPLKTTNPFDKCYDGLSLDYAMTTHRAQGQSVNNAYVLLGGVMGDRELAYVQSSRHRDRLFLYASEEEAGEKLTERARRTRPLAERPSRQVEPIPNDSSLTRQLAQSRAKHFAHAVGGDRSPQLSQPMELHV